MTEDKRMEETQQEGSVTPAEASLGEDWIGDIEQKIQDFKEAMADVAQEADEGMLDGPVGKIAVFLKRYWAVVLVAIIPWVPRLVEHWADNNPFTAMPQIITEAELQEISDYIFDWSHTYEYAMNWVLNIDRDGDGTSDIHVLAFDHDESEREKLYVHTSMELPSIWELLTGKCSLAPQGESLSLQDDKACLVISVSGETKGDRSELRQAVEETLAEIRREKAEQAAGTYVPPQKPYLQDLIDLLLENQRESTETE